MSKEKIGIIRNIDGTFVIIEIVDDTWKVIAGPYLSHEEALPDLRNIKNE